MNACRTSRLRGHLDLPKAIHVDTEIFWDGNSESAFVKAHLERDKTLPLPDRVLHAPQFNLGGDRLPQSESNAYIERLF